MSRARPATRLWKWAESRLQDPVFRGVPEVHLDTAGFVDAIQMSSKVLRLAFPAMRGIAQLRHRLRGTQLPPEVSEMRMLEHWNSSEEFLDGAKIAHEALLQALWRRPGEALPDGLREATSPDVRSWLEGERRQIRGWESGGSEPSDPAHHAEISVVAVRFEHCGGPTSLEAIRHMDLSALPSLRWDTERQRAFQNDIMHGSVLTFQVASVAEAKLWLATSSDGGSSFEEKPLIVRRADRLHLACDFNLRKGIASPFRFTSAEALLTEQHLAQGDEDVIVE